MRWLRPLLHRDTPADKDFSAARSDRQFARGSSYAFWDIFSKYGVEQSGIIEVATDQENQGRIYSCACINIKHVVSVKLVLGTGDEAKKPWEWSGLEGAGPRNAQREEGLGCSVGSGVWRPSGRK